MDNLSKIGIWLNRIVIMAVSVLFLTLGIKNLFHPLINAMKSDIILNSSTALSVARVSMGAFPLALAIVLLTSLFSKPQIFRGILTVFIFIVVTTIARIASLQIDGHSEFGLKVLIPEIIITILSTVGLYLELRRRKRMDLNDRQLNNPITN
jgi:hypothetical protein